MVDTAPEFKITDGTGPVTVDGSVGIQGQLDDVSTVAATEDNLATARITAQRAVHVNLRSNSGTEAGTSGNPLAVSIVGSITATSVRDDQNQQIINGNGYNVVLSTSFTIGSTETNALYFKNNSGSKTVYIFNLFPFQDPTNGNNWVIFRAYFNPTVSANGTSLSAINMVAGSSNTSSANCYSGPTVSARGTMFKIWPSGINNAAAIIQDYPFPNYIVIPPAQSILVTAQCKANGQGMYADIMWYEV